MAAKLISLCLAIVAAALAAATVGASPPAADLHVESLLAEPPGSANFVWVIVVHNNPIPGHLPTEATNVVVRLTATANGQDYKIPDIASGTPHGSTFDDSTGLWTIPSIPPLGSVRAEYSVAKIFPSPFAQDTPLRVHAEILGSRLSVEPEAYHQANNESEAWFVKLRTGTNLRWPQAESGVQVRLADRKPIRGMQVTFDISTRNFTVTPAPELPSPNAYEYHGQFDVRIKVEISPGLSLSPTLRAPPGTSFDPVTGIWDVGYMPGNAEQILSVPVSVTTEDIPLERRCLTATVVNAVPTFTSDSERKYGVSTVCLGKDPTVVVSEGEIILWWIHDCVVVTTAPCGATDELKLFARADNNEVSLPEIERRDVFGQRDIGKSEGLTYLDPDTVIIHLPDRSGRMYDTSGYSITGGAVVSWQTARAESGIHPGVRVWYSRRGFNANISDWSNVVRTLSVSSLDGGDPPGKMRVRHDNISTRTFYNPAPPTYTHRRSPFNLATTTNRDNDYFLEFDSLGTYVVNFHALATRTDNKPYAASGDYIFHVGPIAELEVRDGGGGPLATPGQQAYTIMAANNGPDTAPAVQVTLTGVPQGAEAVLADGDGMYRETSCEGGLCEAVWDLGELLVSTPRPAAGLTPFPTLTLIAPAGVVAPDTIQAAIANTEDYSVEIDSVTHSTHYFDYIEDNDTADIAARAGAGGGARARPSPSRCSCTRTRPRRW